MSSNFSPWETSDNSGADLTGTMTADRASGPTYNDIFSGQINPVAQEMPAQAGGFASGMGSLADVIQGAAGRLGAIQPALMAQQQEEPPPIGQITRKADGTTDLKGVSSKFLEDVMGQLSDLKTMKAAAMARVAQLRQQESSGSPILDALSQFAGGMAANDPTMPGWVRALGQTNLQMGPQGIKRERMAEEQKAIGLSGDIAQMGLAAAKLEDQKAQDVAASVEAMRKGADKVEKDRTDTLVKLRREGRAQVMASGEYDAEGLREELRTLNLPEDQIEAQISSLEQFAADRKKHLDAIASAKSEDERKKADDSLRKWENAQDRIDARATQRAANAFGWNVMKMSVPSTADVSLVKNTSSLMTLLDKADAYLGQVPERYRGGPISGFFKEKNPWRDSKDQDAFQTAYKLNLSALEASGLKPISEIEFKKSMEQMFNPRNTWAQNKKIIDNLRAQVVKDTGSYLQMNRHRDWTPVAPLLPPALQRMLPDLEARRQQMYADAAPQPIGGGAPGAVKKYPWE